MPRIHDMEVSEYLSECVSVEPSAIHEEFVRVAGDLAYWNSKYADALRAERYAELELSKTEARLQITERERLSKPGDKGRGPTVDQVRAAVEQSPEWILAKTSAIEAEYSTVRHKGLAEAVRAKKDMVVSLGSQLRAEMGSDPGLRAEVRTAREAKAFGF